PFADARACGGRELLTQGSVKVARWLRSRRSWCGPAGERPGTGAHAPHTEGGTSGGGTPSTRAETRRQRGGVPCYGPKSPCPRAGTPCSGPRTTSHGTPRTSHGTPMTSHRIPKTSHRTRRTSPAGRTTVFPERMHGVFLPWDGCRVPDD